MEQDIDLEELYHHGVKGQRWGFRRYQNPDGSLTPEGKRRARELAEQYAKVTGKKLVVKIKKKNIKADEIAKEYEKITGQKIKDNQKKEKNIIKDESRNFKNINKLSDEDISKRMKRLKLENDYKSLVNSNNYKEDRKKGSNFVSNVKNKIIIPAITDASRNVLRNIIENGLNNMLKGYGNNKNNRNNRDDYNKDINNKNKDKKTIKITTNNIDKGKKYTSKKMTIPISEFRAISNNNYKYIEKNLKSTTGLGEYTIDKKVLKQLNNIKNK